MQVPHDEPRPEARRAWFRRQQDVESDGQRQEYARDCACVRIGEEEEEPLPPPRPKEQPVTPKDIDLAMVDAAIARGLVALERMFPPTYPELGR